MSVKNEDRTDYGLYKVKFYVMYRGRERFDYSYCFWANSETEARDLLSHFSEKEYDRLGLPPAPSLPTGLRKGEKVTSKYVPTVLSVEKFTPSNNASDPKILIPEVDVVHRTKVDAKQLTDEEVEESIRLGIESGDVIESYDPKTGMLTTKDEVRSLGQF